ncbi:hypothetical protein pipiens_014915, partial [Culex pipiens pipiens]
AQNRVYLGFHYPPNTNESNSTFLEDRNNEPQE